MTKEKKKIFNGIKKRIRTPIFAGLTLFFAVVCFVVCALLPEYSYRQQGGNVYLENPETFCTSKDGWNAIVDDRDAIYCLSPKGELVYAVDVSQFPYENAEIMTVTFHTDNRLYCHLAIYNSKAYLTDAEAVYEIDTKGNIVREVTFYDYKNMDNPPSHQVRLLGLHLKGSKLRYLYQEENGSSLVEFDIENPQKHQSVLVKQVGYGEIVKCHSTSENGFLILKNNGEIGTISYDGVYQQIDKASFHVRKDEGLYPYDVCMVGDTLYMLEGQKKLELYRWQDANWRLMPEVQDEFSQLETVGLYSHGMGELENQLVIHANDTLYVLQDGFTTYNLNAKLSPLVTVQLLLKQWLPGIGILLLILGLYSTIGNLMGWRFTILSKQLLSTIPMVLLILAAVIVSMLISLINMNAEDVVRETIAINEIAAAQFEGEELADITGFDSVDNGTVQSLSHRLRSFVNGNLNGWSRNYNTAIFVRTEGEHFVSIASSDGSNQFMESSIVTDIPIDQEFYEDSHTFVDSISYGEERENLQLVLITPIYDKMGNYDAIMVLVASQDRLIQTIVATGTMALVYVTVLVALLILVISVVSAYNVKSLKRAKQVVEQIAQGDFTARVDNYSNDEAGEICAGINDMASQLEDYFREKNTNEQFYYKFVPEKFRELLHKEKFTDLALGDAQSEDLSILFCDIRAFSMNSEMMTARESFEFVNRIYGIAGPIIRKHNGFIDKYIGDAIMALFEHAEDAVFAGIELYQAIVLHPNAEEAFGLPSVKVGIGIHSGMARIGIVGEKERMSGTVISNTVNLSSRMEALTKRYGAGMIISKDTLDRMDNPDALSTRYLGMVQVAGVNEVAALYEVLDCLEDEQRNSRHHTALNFREAVRLFHTGDLHTALEKFIEIAEANPQDKAPKLYVDYIEKKLESGDTKHNVFCFENKQ